ncbi:MAG: TrkA family potassium uptake protein [Nocardioides sp.]|uniref:potassium channel family protein n=1 Tax=Nocardioides sp. TaxID=35761 RepID=UPI00238FC181|nr:TrkA family potassium uptake protein [Nocardioides sp.]MDE0778627.1 TrkA family potassium uptake protein [Nocardioides sp.]
MAKSHARASSWRKPPPHDHGTVVVVGLGRFGKSLALELMEQGTEVLGIDADRRIVQSLAGRLTHVVEADSTNEDAMRQLSVAEFDRAVIGVGNDLEASILSASVALGLGVEQVWAKAISHAHARILTQIGVHHVVRPEHDMGKRVAHLVNGRMLDYIEIDEGYAIVKTRPPRRLYGVPLGQSTIRAEFGVTVVGVKRGTDAFTYATAETVVEDGDIVIVSGPRENVERFSELT